MPHLYLIRHGKAAAGWGVDLDPGLDATGRAQAAAMARAMAPLGPLPILCSPLKRTRETAAPLAAAWQAEIQIEPAIGEVPSPDLDLSERAGWLRSIFQRNWSELDAALHAWRAQLVDRLASLSQDTVLVTHFVAINAAVAAATGNDRVLAFQPDNCSRTVLQLAAGRLELVERGVEAATRVL